MASNSDKVSVTDIANMMLPYIQKSTLPDIHPEYGKDHLNWMVSQILYNFVQGEKAHRWIGWIQGCLCMSGAASLEELKNINLYGRTKA